MSINSYCVRVVRQSIARWMYNEIHNRHGEEFPEDLNILDKIRGLDFCSFLLTKGTDADLNRQNDTWAERLQLKSRHELALLPFASAMRDASIHVARTKEPLKVCIFSAFVAGEFLGEADIGRLGRERPASEAANMHCSLHSQGLGMGIGKLIRYDSVRARMNKVLLTCFGPIIGASTDITLELMENFGKDCIDMDPGVLTHLSKEIDSVGGDLRKLEEQRPLAYEIYQAQMELHGEERLHTLLEKFRANRKNRSIVLRIAGRSDGGVPKPEDMPALEEIARHGGMERTLAVR